MNDYCINYGLGNSPKPPVVKATRDESGCSCEKRPDRIGLSDNYSGDTEYRITLQKEDIYMLNDLFTNHGSVIFFSILLLVVLSGLISSRKKSRKERPDLPLIFAPIRGMYVCYQCDTIFNTARCPKCGEEAVIPLIHLTGSVMEDERVASVLGRLQRRSTWKLPTFQSFQDGQAVTSESRPEVSNGSASEVPVTIAVLSSERGRELS